MKNTLAKHLTKASLLFVFACAFAAHAPAQTIVPPQAGCDPAYQSCQGVPCPGSGIVAQGQGEAAIMASWQGLLIWANSLSFEEMAALAASNPGLFWFIAGLL